MRIQKTEEKYITYDTVKKKFRVVVKKQHVCYTLTMEEAKRRRDHHLLLKRLT
jgi:hypothetical protein